MNVRTLGNQGFFDFSLVNIFDKYFESLRHADELLTELISCVSSNYKVVP